MTNINFTTINEEVLWKIIRTNLKAIHMKINELIETDEKSRKIANVILDRYHKTMVHIWNTDFCHSKFTSYSHRMNKVSTVYTAANHELSFRFMDELVDYAWVGCLMRNHLGRVINILDTTWKALNNHVQWYAEYVSNKETKNGI